MKKVIINEFERGFLFKNGKYVKMLTPGKYYEFGNSVIERVAGTSVVASKLCSLETLLEDKGFAEAVTVCDVADEQIALHFVDDKFHQVLLSGKHAVWNNGRKHEFRLVDISNPETAAEVPAYIFKKLPTTLYTTVTVDEYEKARLFIDNRFVRLLDAGTHYFWNIWKKVDAIFVDTRLTQLNVPTQELLTKDKVEVRVSFVCTYRIVDFLKIYTEIEDFKEQLYVCIQLALREYVGSFKLDELLDNKEQLSEYVYNKIKARERELFIEISEAGVKDIILPGEIRNIMNTVLLAEKRAQANVITRREEVASTRSLLNTAKLMDENRTLYKLKELEYAERICENVGNINLNGNADLLSQLSSLLRSNYEGA